MDYKKIEEDIWNNKIEKGFNITNVDREFNLLYGEVAEAFDAYRKKKDDVGEELADVAIYLIAIAKMLNVDLESEIIHKVEKNKKRVYVRENGVSKRIKEGD